MAFNAFASGRFLLKIQALSCSISIRFLYPEGDTFLFVSIYETSGSERNGRVCSASFPRRFSGVPGSSSARRKKERRAHRERKTDRKTTCANNFTLREIGVCAALHMRFAKGARSEAVTRFT